ncbi:hypothetical protein L8106_28406 [Lyngbya sp. PCC 8106]|nr:hypothetical protein L8106_28406 [Lyngbya sp. PCC 8106]
MLIHLMRTIDEGTRARMDEILRLPRQKKLKPMQRKYCKR